MNVKNAPNGTHRAASAVAKILKARLGKQKAIKLMLDINNMPWTGCAFSDVMFLAAREISSKPPASSE